MAERRTRLKRSLMPIVCLILALQARAGSPVGQNTLTGVFMPEMITIAGDTLYVVEGPEVLAYSLKDRGLLRKIGGRGEGPGEFRAADYWYNTVTVLPDAILVDGFDKTVRFSKEGKLINEARKPVGFSRMVPVGENFVAVKLEHFEKELQFHCLHLLNAKGEFLKELGRQESPVQQTTRAFEMIPDVLNFAVWDDKVFVEKSREGFVLEIYDSRGERIGRIERKAERTPVTDADRNEAVEAVKTIPFVKRAGFEEFKRMSTLVWPDALPAIRDFAVAGGKIFVRTSKRRGDRENWLVLDMRGEILSDVYLPRVENAPLLATLNGVHYYAVHDARLYYLKADEATDDWGLFIAEFK
jgi:hypothetical protein